MALREKQIVGTFRFAVPYAGYLLAKMDGKMTVVVIFWIVLLNAAFMVLSTVCDDDEGEADDQLEDANTDI